VSAVLRDRWSMWALYEAAWHRPDPDCDPGTMCGRHLPCEVESVSTEAAAAEIAANRTSVCGRCERLVQEARERVTHGTGLHGRQAVLEDASLKSAQLSPEQQALKEWLDLERERRREARRLIEVDEKTKTGASASVRTVSGGLPTLGKKRR
jgi:hypothetical protein